MLIALVGPDRYLVGESLAAYSRKYAPPDDGMGDLNFTRLDGARLTPDELSRSAQSLGFFSDRRLVLVEGLLTRFAGKAGDEGMPAEAPAKGRGKRDESLTEQFAAIFAAIPDSTVLILVERGAVNKGSVLLKAAARYGKVEEHLPPKGVALERWVKERAAKLGVRVTPGAQSALAAGLHDLTALATELEKLALAVGDGGQIDERVLREMSYVAKADDVFEMTSAVARRDTRAALGNLHRLLDGGNTPEGIMPVLAWQIRTLIAVRDLLDRRVSEGRMAEASGLTDYTLRKAIPQARQFTMPALLHIHSRLLSLDHAVKTGRADAEMTLDALVVDMCR